MPISARERIADLFESFDDLSGSRGLSDPIGFPGYRREVRTQFSASVDESVVIGRASIGGMPLVAAVFDFGFMGGSMGRVAGDRLAKAMRIAGRERIPFVAVTATGGARMQEGMAALAQMPRTVAASSSLSSKGVPKISIFGNPTTGGVYASFASLADFAIAESDAVMGFAGPRVAETFTGKALPHGSHTAEAALRAGLVDAVVAPADLAAHLRTLVGLLAPGTKSAAAESATPAGRGGPARVAGPPVSDASQSTKAWREYALARDMSRPSPRNYLEMMYSSSFELRGDRSGNDDPAVVTTLAMIGGQSVMAVGFERASPTASGFRKARRALEIAGRLRLPVLTLIDTPGADPSFESEYSGLAYEIAKTFETLLGLQTKTVCAITGEGGSGGALALACCDVIGIQSHAVFSVIGPEGAASILYRDSTRASEVAELLKPTATDLVKLGLADEVIDEPESGAHTDPRTAARLLQTWVERALQSASGRPSSRARRFSRTARSL